MSKQAHAETPERNRRIGRGIDESLHWYMLIVAPNKEFAAQQILAKAGLPTYVPIDTKFRWKNRYDRKRNRHKPKVSYPLFPRYVFTGFEAAIPPWYHIRNMSVIQGVVGINGTPSEVNAARLAEFASRIGGGLVAPDEQRYMPTHREFSAGDLAEAFDGPFAGQRFQVKAIEGAHAKVAMTLFGGAVDEVRVPLSVLQAA